MMSKENMVIWGRSLELEVKYDCYTGEEVQDAQKEALSAFLESRGAVDAALDRVKEYCLKRNKADIGSDNIDNIFKYVAPRYLYVARSGQKHVVAVMCNYKFDPENGLAIVFEDEEFSRIGTQDIIL